MNFLKSLVLYQIAYRKSVFVSLEIGIFRFVSKNTLHPKQSVVAMSIIDEAILIRIYARQHFLSSTSRLCIVIDCKIIFLVSYFKILKEEKVLDYKTGHIIQYEDEGINSYGVIITKFSNKFIVANLAKPDNPDDKSFSFTLSSNDLPDSFDIEKFSINMNDIQTIKRNQIKRNITSLNRKQIEELLKIWAKMLAKTYYESVHLPMYSNFYPGKTKINYGGRVFDEKEIDNLVNASLDFWLTTGKYSQAFEKNFAQFLGVKYCSLVNSGSSANLLAFMTLTSPLLGDRRIKKGDEIITVAASFPTTVSPIIQYGAIPVFVDITLPTYNIDCSVLEEALSPKTKAVMLAHTMGNPFDIEKVKAFCDKNALWLIEDNCDALGSRYFYKNKWQYTGVFGDIATSSFYPPHHITMGEGGAVYTNNPKIAKIINSLRDWGRDCWCPSGKDNTCKKRFKWKLGELPDGYDHKYIYSHFGYNLKATDMQAAVGLAQLEKLPNFIERRKRNWKILRDGLDELSDIFILPEPTPNSDPSWFGFLLTIKDGTKFARDKIVRYLEKKGIQTRMLFAGNLIKQPCFDEMRKAKKGYKVVGNLDITDKIMNDCFWIGVYPAINDSMAEYMIEKIKEAVKIGQK